jgi:hypothetical protein
MTDTAFPAWDRKEPYADWRERMRQHHDASLAALRDSMTPAERKAAAERGVQAVREMLEEWEDLRKG